MSASGMPPFSTDEPPPLKTPPSVMQSYKPDVPDFMRLGSVPVNYLQEVETDLLEPVVFDDGRSTSTDGFCRFQLQNKGFLHSHSKIFMSLIPPSAVDRAVLPPNVGIGSVISRAVLKIGNVVLNEVSDWDYLYSFHSTKITSENNVERELYTTGRYMHRKFNYADGDDTNASTYAVATGRDINGSNYQQLPFSVMKGASPSQSPSYSVDLSDLFPFLKVYQLPLYMIQQPVTIELTLRPPIDHRAVLVAGTVDQPFVLDQNELKFCADYIFYGATDEMEQYAEKNKKLGFSFSDYRAITTTVSQAGLRSDTVRNLGMANRQVSRVLTVFNTGRQTETDLLLNLGALAMDRNASDVVGDFSYNLRYNDRFEFSSNVTNTARLFSLLQSAEVMAHITRDEYTGEGGGYNASTLFETKEQQANFSGKSFLTSVRLTGGRVGQRGIELHVRATDMNANVTTMRNWCEYLRTAVLEGGMMSVYNV